MKLLMTFFITLLSFQLNAETHTFNTEQYELKVEQVANGLQHPWSLEFLPDGRILVTERPGYLRYVENGEVSKPIRGLPDIKAFGQGGLLDIALDPDFDKNNTIYLSYAGPGEDGVSTEVVSATLSGQELTNVKRIFVLQEKTETGYHFGSRLQFDRAGYLYISLGDRGEKERSQALDDHAGSLIRINKDGSIPADNPFVNTAGAKPEIYTYGNRNMQGMAMHPVTGDIWTIEHGPQGGDELNLMIPGTNYGWPVITYGVNYGIGTKIGEGTEKPGMAQPVHYWVPSIATSGLIFYSSDQFPKWENNAFVGALVAGQLARLTIDDNKVIAEERIFKGEFGRIRDVKQGPDGAIYFVTDETNGKMYKVSPM
ncbi:MAG: PQQ-dependent sugar dehydrogenase [Pseudomonadota bacterium]